MELNKYIDHTNLKADATIRDIEKLCDEAVKYKFASVCVSPYYVPLAHELLEDSNVNVCTVIGFPLGQNTTSTKAYEAIEAINNGADEIDMVINIAALKNEDYDYVKEEIEEIRDSIDGKVLKVIIETCYLTQKEITKMTEICNKTFVNFIKTSTGFGSGGASLEDIRLFKKHIGPNVQIKAAGGIRSITDMKAYIAEGCSRIGASAAVELLKNHLNEEV